MLNWFAGRTDCQIRNLHGWQIPTVVPEDISINMHMEEVYLLMFANSKTAVQMPDITEYTQEIPYHDSMQWNAGNVIYGAGDEDEDDHDDVFLWGSMWSSN